MKGRYLSRVKGVQKWSLTRVRLRRIHFHSLFSSNPPRFTPKKEKLHKPLFSNALGSRNAYSQEHFRNSNLSGPSKGIRILRSKNPGIHVIFARRIRNRGLWSLEYSLRNLESTDDWYPESIFQGQKIRNPVLETVKNPRRGIQNPRLSWISLHGSKLMQNLGDKQIRGIRK